MHRTILNVAYDRTGNCNVFLVEFPGLDMRGYHVRHILRNARHASDLPRTEQRRQNGLMVVTDDVPQ